MGTFNSVPRERGEVTLKSVGDDIERHHREGIGAESGVGSAEADQQLRRQVMFRRTVPITTPPQ